MIAFTQTEIQLDKLLESVADEACGASVLFVGTTRRWTGGKETVQLKYEAYEEMARIQLERLAEEAKQRWSIQNVAIVHRLGEVAVGEASVAVCVSSPHRAAAFEAAQWLIDELKKSVPIWKQEHWNDQSSAWIHPTP